MKIGIIGSNGKMGNRLIACIQKDELLSFTWGLSSSYKDPLELPTVDVIIDFSSKEALTYNLDLAKKKNTPIVIGTTGLEEKEKKAVEEASLHIPLFISPNFSLGLALTAHFAKKLSSLLPHMTAYIEETHHIHKKDSPSGSALAIKDAIIEGNGKRSPQVISHRVGEVIGEHSASFIGEEEVLTLSHSVSSRDAFAKGALEAAKFLCKQPKGLYQMSDLFSII